MYLNSRNNIDFIVSCICES